MLEWFTRWFFPSKTENRVVKINYVEDLSVSDEIILDPGVSAVKSLRFENDSNCDLGYDDVSLVLCSDIACISKPLIPVPAVMKGEYFTMDIPFRTPQEPGTYFLTYMFVTNDTRVMFWPLVWIYFTVEESRCICDVFDPDLD